MRLARRPSQSLTIITLAVSALLWVGCFVAITVALWHPHTAVFLACVDLVAVIVLWDIAARLFRASHCPQPWIEIDKPSLHYGDGARLHLIDSHTASLCDLEVALIGECDLAAATELSQHRETIAAPRRCYEEELLRIAPLGLPIDRTLSIQLPKSAPADRTRWSVLVTAHLKQGGVVEHPFPLPVLRLWRSIRLGCRTAEPL